MGAHLINYGIIYTIAIFILVTSEWWVGNKRPAYGDISSLFPGKVMIFSVAIPYP